MNLCWKDHSNKFSLFVFSFKTQTHHLKLISSSKCRIWASSCGYLVLWTMLILWIVNDSILISTDNTVQKTYFSAVKAAIHTWENIVQNLSVSVHTTLSILHFASILTLLSNVKLMQHLLAMFFRAIPMSDIDNASNSSTVLQNNFCLQHQNHYF